LSPWDAGVGDEDVETSAELLGDAVDGVPDILLGGDVDLVGAAWRIMSARVTTDS